MAAAATNDAMLDWWSVAEKMEVRCAIRTQKQKGKKEYDPTEESWVQTQGSRGRGQVVGFKMWIEEYSIKAQREGQSVSQSQGHRKSLIKAGAWERRCVYWVVGGYYRHLASTTCVSVGVFGGYPCLDTTCCS